MDSFEIETPPPEPASPQKGEAKAEDPFGKATSRLRWLILVLGVAIQVGPYWA
jgi:hypothetical protein